MPEVSKDQKINESDMLNRVVRGVVLIVVSLVLASVSVSFAVHHMRLQFEEEFKGISDAKMTSVCDMVRMTVHGDEIIADSATASTKYSNVFNLMLSETSEDSLSTESYALFMYTGGEITLLTKSEGSEDSDFIVTKKDVSEWLSSDNAIYTAEGESYESIFVPISDSSGRCVAVFEYKCSYAKLTQLGNELETRVMTAVYISVASGVVLFGISMLVPRFFKKSSKGGNSF